MQTAIYLRMSQDRTGEGLGAARQLEDCQTLATELGWTVAEIYKDNDISATSKKPRPDYRRMLGDLQSGRLEAVIAWHPDRLYRRLTDLEELFDLCRGRNIQIRTVQHGGFDLATASGQFVAGILAQAARYEVQHKADRWQRSVQQRRQAGEPPKVGGRLFGYDRDGEIIEGEAETVRWLADRVLAGTTLRSLAADLNKRGITTTRGGQWRQHSIRELLDNPRLAGHSTLRGQVVGQGQWAPILDDTTWQSIHALLVARSNTKAPRVALLPGLIFCGHCDLPLSTSQRTDGTRRYVCNQKPGHDNCGRISIVSSYVEDLVEDLARKYLSHPKIRRRIAEARAGGQTHILAELDAQEQKLAEIQESIAAGGRHLKLLLGAADTVADRIDELQRQLATTSPVDLPDDIDLGWPTELGQRRRLVELVVARVTVAPAKGRTGSRFDPTRVDVEPTDLVTG